MSIWQCPKLLLSIKDCPKGYECPETGSIDTCMVQVGQGIKFHGGCFLENNEAMLGRGWNANDCAANCNEDPLCKGFSIGFGDKYLRKRGCVFATERKDCTSTWGFIQFYSPYVGDLLETTNIDHGTMKKYGFSGCYRKATPSKNVPWCFKYKFSENQFLFWKYYQTSISYPYFHN